MRYRERAGTIGGSTRGPMSSAVFIQSVVSHPYNARVNV